MDELRIMLGITKTSFAISNHLVDAEIARERAALIREQAGLVGDEQATSMDILRAIREETEMRIGDAVARTAADQGGAAMSAAERNVAVTSASTQGILDGLEVKASKEINLYETKAKSAQAKAMRSIARAGMTARQLELQARMADISAQRSVQESVNATMELAVLAGQMAE